MKKTVAVIVLFLSCWCFAAVAEAACNPSTKTATVVIDVEDGSFSYGNKTGDPVPCIFRTREIEVTVNFPDSNPNRHYVVLKDFRALFFVGQAGQGSWVHDFNDPYALKVADISGGHPPADSIKFENTTATHTDTKTIQLQSVAGPGGPNRLITFTLEIADKQGNVVMTFDPPWGERP